MRLGLNFDDTVTIDPELFGALVVLFKASSQTTNKI